MASPEEMAQSMINNMPEKTGKALDEWIAMLKDEVKQHGLEKQGQVTKHLKAEHGVTHGFANLIASQFLQSQSGDAPKQGDELIDAQYAGKENLRPVYDAIINEISTWDGIEISPKKAYVSLRAKKQFALIQPSTKSRVDIGINFTDRDTTDRLEKSGSFNAMVSHRVRTSAASDVDQELLDWLKAAFDAAK